MIEGIPIIDVGATALLTVVFLAVLTDRLVWHKRLRAAEAERDEWRRMALESLGITGRVVGHAEVTHELISRLPRPGTEPEETTT